MMEKKKKEVPLLGLHCIPFTLVYIQIILDFRKDNLVILLIKSLIPYQRSILPNFWEDNLMVLVIKFIFPYQRPILSLLRINLFEAYRIQMLGDPWTDIQCVILSLSYLFLSIHLYEVGWPIGGLRTLNMF